MHYPHMLHIQLVGMALGIIVDIVQLSILKVFHRSHEFGDRHLFYIFGTRSTVDLVSICVFSVFSLRCSQECLLIWRTIVCWSVSGVPGARVENSIALCDSNTRAFP